MKAQTDMGDKGTVNAKGTGDGSTKTGDGSVS